MYIKPVSSRLVSQVSRNYQQPMKQTLSTSINNQTIHSTRNQYAPSISNLDAVRFMTPAHPYNSQHPSEMLSEQNLFHFNNIIQDQYLNQTTPKVTQNSSGVLELAKKARIDLSKGAPSWPFPNEISKEFTLDFNNNPNLFEPNTPIITDNKTIAKFISQISNTEFKHPIHAIPTPSSKITAALAFHTLKNLGVTHVAVQVPWFTPSVIAALSADLTIVPIFSKDESNVCNDLQYFSEKYRSNGVLLHNATNPVYRELSDEASEKVTSLFEASGTFLISDCAYFGYGPLSPRTGLLKFYLSKIGSQSRALGLLSVSKSPIRIPKSQTGFALSNNPQLLEALSKTITKSKHVPSKLDAQFALSSLKYTASEQGQQMIHNTLSNCAIARDNLIKKLSAHDIVVGNQNGIFLSTKIFTESGIETIFRIPSFALNNENIEDIANGLINAHKQGLDPTMLPYKGLFKTAKGILALDHGFFSPPSSAYIL